MTSKWLDYDRYREIATNYLLKHKKTPSAVIMREAFGGNGSLSTHQNLIERWKNESDGEIVGLPEKAELIIVRKTRELFAEGWKALEDQSHQQNLKITQEAEERIHIAQEILDSEICEKHEVIKELNRISEELNKANADNQLLQIKINEAEKLCFAAEEAKRELANRLDELKQNTQREREELEKQYSTRERDLREQLTSNEIRHQAEIKRWEEEKEAYKNSYEQKILTIEIVRDELYAKLTHAASEVSHFETKYQQTFKEIEVRATEIEELRQEKQTYWGELQNKELLFVKQASQLEFLEKQLNEYREKNSALENILNAKNVRIGELEEKVSQELKGAVPKIRSTLLEETT